MRAACLLVAGLLLAACGGSQDDEETARKYLERIKEPVMLLHAAPLEGNAIEMVFLDPDGDSLRVVSRVKGTATRGPVHPELLLGGRPRSESGIRVPWRGQAEHHMILLLGRWLDVHGSDRFADQVTAAVARLRTGR